MDKPVLPPKPPAPAPAPPPPVEVKVAPVLAPNPGVKACPICTTPNAKGATVCRGCGNPLGGVTPPQTGGQETPRQWGLIIAIAAAALLAVALVIVLIFK